MKNIHIVALLFCVTSLLPVSPSFALEKKTKGPAKAFEQDEKTASMIMAKLQDFLNKAEVISSHLALVSHVGQQGGLTEETLKKLGKSFLDHHGDESIAGGGIWFEPKVYAPDTDRFSFFWARDEQQDLKVIMDYNRPGPQYVESAFEQDEKYRREFLNSPGYHHEEWYVIGKHLDPRRKGIWSKSYTDPYSFEPMVTFTSPIRGEGHAFLGVATVDLKLNHLYRLCKEWGKMIKGHVFILDRDNKLISFFDHDRSRIMFHDTTSGKVRDEYLSFEELVKGLKEYAPLSKRIIKMDQEYRKEFEDKELSQRIDRESYQLNLEQAGMISALNSKEGSPAGDWQLYSSGKVAIKDDPYLHAPSTAYLYKFPAAHWKVVVILPQESPKDR